MHELSIAESIVSTAVNVARENNTKKVWSIHVEVGVLSGVVADSLLFCFSIASKGTILEESQTKLEVKTLPLEFNCANCGGKTQTDEIALVCRHCGSNDVSVISGQELKITSLEVD